MIDTQQQQGREKRKKKEMGIFNILIDLKDSDPFILKRSQEALEIFAQDLSTFEFPSSIEQYRKALASQQLNEENLNIISCENLQIFLSYCFSQANIVLSEATARFLSDPSEEVLDQSITSPITALDFLLQPFENQQIYIPRNQQFYIDIKLEKGETLVWRYQLGSGQNIDFFAIFCESMFRSIKSHSNSTQIHTNNNNNANNNNTNDNNTSDDDCISELKESNLDPSSPSSLERKLSSSLDNFIKLGNHRKVLSSSSLKSTNTNISNVEYLHQISNDNSIYVISHSSPMFNWGHQIPSMKSILSSPTDLSLSLNGCFKAEKKGGMCRLLWDNSLSNFTGKHLEYCIQKVNEATMEVNCISVSSLLITMISY